MLSDVENQENYTASRMVLAASGVEHEELLSVAEPLLSDLPSVPRPEEPKSNYVGGDFRRQGESGVGINLIKGFLHLLIFLLFLFVPFQMMCILTYLLRTVTRAGCTCSYCF